jgi:hypothetical protein
VAQSNAQVIIEADAHDIATLKREWLAKARTLAITYGLAKNLIDKVDIKYFR